MKKICKKALDVFLSMVVLYFLLLIFSGCSSKKKAVQSDLSELKTEVSGKAETAVKAETNINFDTRTTVDDKTKIVTTKKTATPLDPKKPARFTDSSGNQIELNNVSLTEETTTEEKDVKKENVDKSKVLHQEAAGSKIESKGKIAAKKEIESMDLDRSGFNFWSWFWIALGIILVVVMVYLNNRFAVLRRVTAFFRK